MMANGHIQVLLNALDAYARPENWDGWRCNIESQDRWPDQGKLARDALAKFHSLQNAGSTTREASDNG